MPIWFVIAVPFIAFAGGFWSGRVLSLKAPRPGSAPVTADGDEPELQRLINRGLHKLESAVDGVLEDNYRERYGALWFVFYKRLDGWIALGLVAFALGLATHFLYALAGETHGGLEWEPAVSAVLFGAAVWLDHFKRRVR